MANIDAIKILGSILNSGALSRGSGSDILGSVIGAMTGGGRSQGGRGQSQGGGGLGSILGGILGGGRSQGNSGGMFGSGSTPQPRANRGAAGGPDIGDILGGLLGGGSSSSGGGGLGDLLGAAMGQLGGSRGGARQANYNTRNQAPQGRQYEQMNDQATIMIKAMINAAKADGQVDQEEQQKIIAKLGEITQDEIDFVRDELAQPLDLPGFIRSIPRGLEQQVYAVSLMAIDLDTNAEAQYLHQLAQGTGISQEVSNMIHQQFGAQPIYR